jgi:hypothetical protein
MWVGVTLSVVLELMPEKLRSSGVGFYFFIISNIGGNMQNLLPPLQTFFKEKYNFSNLDSLRSEFALFSIQN